MKDFRALAHALLLSGTTLLVGACAESPTGRHQLLVVDDAQINQMGAATYTDIKSKTPATTNARANAFVACVARDVTATTNTGNWEVTVFQSDEVNAFALPGGKIGVYTGLLKVATTQDQLATVLGHEVGHVLAHHSAERASQEQFSSLGSQLLSSYTGYNADMISQGTKLLILLPYSRTQESEADQIGLDLMARAGFDPHQAVTLWQKMQAQSAQSGGGPSELLSTHPSDATRIARLQELLPEDVKKSEQARAQGLHPKCGHL